MGWPAKQSWLRFPVWTMDISLLWSPQTGSGGLTKAPSQCMLGDAFLWRRDGPLSSADVKIEWSYASTPPYGFMACSDKFTFTFISACSFGNTKVLKQQEFDNHCYIYIWIQFNLLSLFCTASVLILQTVVLFNYVCYEVNQSFLFLIKKMAQSQKMTL
jgi:hypothetical protein